MEIDEMKLGDLKKIAAMFSGGQHQQHPFVGKHVICRCYSAGVHSGVLVSQTGDQAVLKDARRLWSWKAKEGVALSGVAVHGISGGKIDVMLPEIALTGVIETIPTSEVARGTIDRA